MKEFFSLCFLVVTGALALSIYAFLFLFFFGAFRRKDKRKETDLL